MLVKTNLIFKGYDAFTFYPFIFVRPARAKDTALIAHELVHYREQKKYLVLPWLWRYFTSRSFRLRAELRGYAEQVRLNGLDVAGAVKMLATYGSGYSEEGLTQLLQAELQRLTTTPDLYTLVGAQGQSRIEIFRQMSPGWDSGSGEALNLESLHQANEYAKGMGYRADVGVFMSQEGNLVLNWNDPPTTPEVAGKTVEIEFGQVASVYIERTGAEFRALYGDPIIPKPPALKTAS
ncbi:hypothetical protein D3C71_79670 [compost metagenome]